MISVLTLVLLSCVGSLKAQDRFAVKTNLLYGGVSYGYSILLGRRWNVEFTVGVGVLYLNYDRYECPKCGQKVESDARQLFFGPTKAGITISFLLF